MANSKLATFCLLLGTAACAANSGAHYTPISDGPQSPSFPADLAACQELATNRSYLNDDVKNDAMIGAGIGALAGALDNSNDTAEGLIVGGLIGALAGGGARSLETRDERRRIVVACMQGRGHKVVG